MTIQAKITGMIVLGLSIISFQGCGQHIDANGAGTPGENGVSGTPGGGGENPGVVETDPSEEGVEPGMDLNTIPNLEIAPYDFSLPAPSTAGSGGSLQCGLTSARALTRSVVDLPPPLIGNLSTAGCQINNIKWHLYEDASELNTFVCYIKKSQEADPNVTVPFESWGYYEGDIPADGGGTHHIRVRMGNFNSQLKMDACTRDERGFHRSIEMRLNMSDEGVDGYMTRAESSTDACRLDVSIGMDENRNVTSVSYFDHDRDQTDAGVTSRLEMGFDADLVGLTNDLYGEFTQESETWGRSDLRLFGLWSPDGTGSVKYSTIAETAPPTSADCLSWGVPEISLNACVGKCYSDDGSQEVSKDENGRCATNFSRIESYGTNVPPSDHQQVVIPNSGPNYEAVGGIELSSYMDIQDTSSFVDEWDCQSPTGFHAMDEAGTAKLTECGPTYALPLLQTCESEEWAQRLETNGSL
jgi:hypothetical protein